MYKSTWAMYPWLKTFSASLLLFQERENISSPGLAKIESHIKNILFLSTEEPERLKVLPPYHFQAVYGQNYICLKLYNLNKINGGKTSNHTDRRLKLG